MTLSAETMREVQRLASDLVQLFTPPELIPGCEVMSVADKDEYATDNGWIEAVVGPHNQQRCRWRGQFNVSVGDYVDVLFFASYRLFVVFGQGGAAGAMGPHWSTVTLDLIGSPVRDRLDEMMSSYLSSGRVTGGGITDNLDGTIDVAAGAGYIRATNDDQDTLLSFEWSAAADLALTADALNYIYVDYNGGSPAVMATTNLATIDHTTDFVIGLVFAETTHVHEVEAGQFLNDFIHRFYFHSYEHDGLERSSGLETAETGVRYLTVNAGVLYWALKRITTGALDTSGADDFDAYYRDGLGGWTEVGGQTQIDNANYDDGSGVLASLTSNRYGVHWLFITPDGDLYSLYGRGDYTLADAQEAGVPTTMPNELAEFAILIAKIIVQEGAASLYSIEYPWTAQFQTGAAVGDHNSLTGLQGGAAGEYYHLTAAEYAALGSGGWPFANILTVSLTDADADYSTIEAALAAASAGDTIWLDTGTYTVSNTLVVDVNYVTIRGNGWSNTLIVLDTGSADDEAVEITGQGVSLENLTVRNWKTTGSPVLCYINGASGVRFRSVYFHGNLATVYGIHCDSLSNPADFEAVDCLLYGGSASGGAGTAVKLTIDWVNTGVFYSGEILQWDTVFEAGDAEYCSLFGTHINQYGTLNITDLNGYWTINANNFYVGDSLQLGAGAQIDEILDSSDTLDATVTDSQLATAKLIYEQAGGGGGAWPDDQKATIGTTEYASITAADTAAGAGDVIKAGAGTFSEQVTWDGTRFLIGTGKGTIIDSSTNPTFTNNIANAELENLSIENDANTTSKALVVAGTYPLVARNCRFYAHGTGSNTAVESTDVTTLLSCELVADTGSTNKAFVQLGSGDTSVLIGCHLTGDVTCSAGTVYLVGCYVDGDIESTDTGTIYIIGGQVTGDVTETSGTIVIKGAAIDGTVGAGVQGNWTQSNTKFSLESGTAVDNIETTLSDPGDDNTIATSAAIRSAIAAGGGGELSVSAYLGSVQSVPNTTDTVIVFDTEVQDPNGWYDTGTGKLQPDEACTLIVYAGICFDSMSDQDVAILRLQFNGSTIHELFDYAAKAGGFGFNVLVGVDFNGSTDYLEAVAYHNHGSARNASATNRRTVLIAWRIE